MGFSNPKRTEAANSNDFKTWDGKKKEAVWPAVDRRVCVCVTAATQFSQVSHAGREDQCYQIV